MQWAIGIDPCGTSGRNYFLLFDSHNKFIDLGADTINGNFHLCYMLSHAISKKT